MIKAPGPAADTLDAIVEQIVSEVDPRRIYLFGSRARGDSGADSDIDLMVEVNGADEAVCTAEQKLRHLFGEMGRRVDFQLRGEGAIEQRKDDPGTIDWDVAREGKLLFTRRDLVSAAIAPPKVVREPGSKPPASVLEWLRIAKQDLYHAKHHLDDELEDWSDEICYLSQQAAEKALKAVIVSRHARPAHTHNLEKLLHHARSLGFALSDLDVDCVLLSEYAVEPRYPSSTNLSRLQAQAAVDAAERVMATVRAHLA
jgi:HEPN domain-containing protein/predicted nucleotidyltransferase